MEKLFSEIEGKCLQDYHADKIQILFACKKRKGALSNDVLAKILGKLGLTDKNTFWDLKKSIWSYLQISTPPVKIAEERNNILNRNINNAGWIDILRNTEGIILIEALSLRRQISKAELEKTLISRILANKSVGTKPLPPENEKTTQEYLPNKADFEAAFHKLATKNREIPIDEVLDMIEVSTQKAGRILMSDWRPITELNFEMWAQQEEGE